jgi:hypothetical protein
VDAAKAVAVCEICRTPKRFTRRSKVTGQCVCPACYHRIFRPRRACGNCGTIGIIAARRGGKMICKDCYQTSICQEPCCACGRVRYVYRRIGLLPMCEMCSDRKYSSRKACGRCGRLCLPKGSSDRNLPLCGACYRRTAQPTRKCSACGEARIVAVRFSSSERLCPTCYLASTEHGTCAQCGAIARLVSSPAARICLRCVRPHRPHIGLA